LRRNPTRCHRALWRSRRWQDTAVAATCAPSTAPARSRWRRGARRLHFH
jgi:hypothetical protein